MRKEGWEALLHEHLHNANNTDFEWGKKDCALWCADWVQRATGEDFAAAWRGKYFNEQTLQQVMFESGFATAEEIADATGYKSVPISFAQRGDVVLHPTLACLGICNGMFSHFLMLAGVTKVNTLKCKKAWRV